MKRLLLGLVFVILMFNVSCVRSTPVSLNVSEDSNLFFTGEVARGESFERILDEDLIFRLNYYDGDGKGWYIWVGNSEQPDYDFSVLVTLPLRGPNSRNIMGLHFRNGDNSGPRTEADHYAPQEIRPFSFVLTETDYHIADNALDKILWPYEYSEEQVQQARQIYNELETATGVLTITDLVLDNLIVGKMPWIETMEFEVTIEFPDEYSE